METDSWLGNWERGRAACGEGRDQPSSIATDPALDLNRQANKQRKLVQSLFSPVDKAVDTYYGR
jgi:hypothetical protein